MSTDWSTFSIQHLIEKTQLKAGRKTPFANKLSFVQQELRLRRKQFLGSYISLRDLLLSDSGINENAVEELSRYMASKTTYFWRKSNEEAETFCFRFFRLAIYATTSGNVARESIDDILRLSECLVRSREIFVIAMKDMLPSDMIGELYDFTESYADEFYTPSFEDAVLGGICVFLGVLKDPQPFDAEDTLTEDKA